MKLRPALHYTLHTCVQYIQTYCTYMSWNGWYVCMYIRTCVCTNHACHIRINPLLKYLTCHTQHMCTVCMHVCVCSVHACVSHTVHNYKELSHLTHVARSPHFTQHTCIRAQSMSMAACTTASSLVLRALMTL